MKHEVLADLKEKIYFRESLFLILVQFFFTFLLFAPPPFAAATSNINSTK